MVALGLGVLLIRPPGLTRSVVAPHPPLPATGLHSRPEESSSFPAMRLLRGALGPSCRPSHGPSCPTLAVVKALRPSDAV